MGKRSCGPMCRENHAAHINGYEVQTILVRGNGRRQRGAYLWIGDKDGKPVGFTNQLRRLRDALNEMLGDDDGK